MRKHDRAEHFFLGKFLGFGFHHHHCVLCRSNNQIQTAIFAQCIRHCRVQNILAIGRETDACGADWAHERNARDGQRSRCGDHRHDVRLCFAVIRHDLRDHVDLVIETFGEQRTTRTVDQTAGECFFFGCTAFTFEEAARDAASSREFFLIMYGQREEILPFTYGFGGGYCAQHHGFAISSQNGAVCLTGNLAGFESEGFAAPFNRYGFLVEHVFSL